jgi:phosphoenolpyruvate carboxykinase (GTP)
MTDILVEGLDVASQSTQHVPPDALANEHIRAFFHESIKRCCPDRIYWCNGSAYEREQLIRDSTSEGLLIDVDRARLPGCYLRRIDPAKVAPIGQYAFFCTPRRQAVPSRACWIEADAAKPELDSVFNGSMIGRTMFVVPFLMRISNGFRPCKVGVQITDSMYVAIRIGSMTRIGDDGLKAVGQSDDFVRCLHTRGELCGSEQRAYYFPLENSLYSIGSGYELVFEGCRKLET